MNAGTHLIDAVQKRKLAPVRHDSAFVHYVDAAKVGGKVPGESLCGQTAPLSGGKVPVPRWRRVKVPGDRTCNACHAAACREPSYIAWDAS